MKSGTEQVPRETDCRVPGTNENTFATGHISRRDSDIVAHSLRIS